VPGFARPSEEPGIAVDARVPAGVVGVHQRLRAICIERDSADAEHSPRAGIFFGESDIEGIARCLDVERCTALAHRRNRIERKRRYRDAVSGYCVERRADGAEDREFFGEGEVDRAAVRGDLAACPGPVGEDDALRPLAVHRVKTVENDAVDGGACGRLCWDARSVHSQDLRFLRCRTDRSKVSPIR
jgi:hypothetical protein